MNSMNESQGHVCQNHFLSKLHDLCVTEINTQFLPYPMCNVCFVSVHTRIISFNESLLFV